MLSRMRTRCRFASLEGFQDVFRYLFRIFVRDGLVVELRHARTGVSHGADDVRRSFNRIGITIFFEQRLLRIDDVPSVGVA